MESTTGHRIALFGDVQGWSSVYETALRALGVDVASGRVPHDLTVVQVGDLIHKGPDSAGVIAMADRLLRNSPDNYVQLTGNHEGQYIGGPFFWIDTVSEDAARTMAQWFVDGASRIAVAFETVEAGPVLVTHGGMSLERWRWLSEPTDPMAAAARLNEQYWNDPAAALKAGAMLRGEPGPPGVAWTEPSRELYEPWASADLVPFAQVHGHATPYSWSHDRWYPGATRRIKKALVIDKERRHTRLALGGRTFFGIDTAFSDRDVTAITPLILTLS